MNGRKQHIDVYPMNMYTNPLVQYGAVIVLAITFLGTIALFGYQALVNIPPQGWETTIIVSGLTLATNILGYHQGNTAANGTAATMAGALAAQATITHNAPDVQNTETVEIPAVIPVTKVGP